MAISSWNKRVIQPRIKIKKYEIRNWSPAAGINIAQYAPQTPFTQLITHRNGLTSRVDTFSTGIGEMNLNLCASGCHFIPTERRYPEDLEKAIDGMDVVLSQITEKDEPRHFERRNKGMNLEYMEHTTFVDNPTLDAVDHVRSIMQNRQTRIIGQKVYQEIERIMTKKPHIFGVPSNAQAKPDRFIKVANDGERNPMTGERMYSAEVGTY